MKQRYQFIHDPVTKNITKIPIEMAKKFMMIKQQMQEEERRRKSITYKN